MEEPCLNSLRNALDRMFRLIRRYAQIVDKDAYGGVYTLSCKLAVGCTGFEIVGQFQNNAPVLSQATETPWKRLYIECHFSESFGLTSHNWHLHLWSRFYIPMDCWM